MAAQKRPSQRHGSKYLASASTMDHARHAFLPRHRDSGILDSLGRFFGGDRGVPKRGSGKDTHHAVRTTHYGSLPQKAQHGRAQDENPVVHFFKSIVTPRTPPPSQGKGRGLSLSRFSWVGDARGHAAPPALPAQPLDPCVRLCFSCSMAHALCRPAQLARRGVRPAVPTGASPEGEQVVSGGAAPPGIVHALLPPRPPQVPPGSPPRGTHVLSTLGRRARGLRP
ncbi:myelin basic protein isoform X1 [Pteropus alecto]|uniref:myelin basic protein isoform X1 n=1 Tax=Pteropus alecto TaxID=9402 RepID=UPI000D533B29|nr:myelin basic protein isoform X1 [Pteropus alecto]